jgi:hypothetical protein
VISVRSCCMYDLFGSKVGINPHGFRRESHSPTGSFISYFSDIRQYAAKYITGPDGLVV